MWLLSANSLVGGFDSSLFLPTGLSGWQTRAITSWSDSVKALSDGTANSGVPMKIILIF